MVSLKRALIFLTALFLFLQPAFTQQKKTNYDALWKMVDSLVEKKGLTQSALTEVNKIYALAKKEKQDAQAISALLYKLKLEGVTDEKSRY